MAARAHAVLRLALAVVGPVLGPAITLAQVEDGTDERTCGDPSLRLARWWAAGQLYSAFLSDIVVASPDDLSVGYGAIAGYRPRCGTLGYTLQLTNTWWLEPELAAADESQVFTRTPQGAIKLGLGIERFYFDHHMRLGFSTGPTILLRRTALDSPGTVGFFLELRPAGVRFEAANLTWVFDPLSLAILVPDTAGIPVVLVNFNTALAVEFDVGMGR